MIRTRYILICAIVLLPCLAVYSIISFFRLSSDTAALRRSVMSSVSGTWEKKIALSAGAVSTGLVRLSSHYFKLEPEPRAALESLRGAEVGVYKLREEPRAIDHAAILAGADKTMSAHGWDRIVGVSEGRDLVAVYFPRRSGWGGTAKCCVMVFNGSDLVVVSARAKPEPLFDLVRQRLIQKDFRRKIDFCQDLGPNHGQYAAFNSTAASGRSTPRGRGEGQSVVMAGGREFDLSIGSDRDCGKQHAGEGDCREYQ